MQAAGDRERGRFDRRPALHGLHAGCDRAAGALAGAAGVTASSLHISTANRAELDLMVEWAAREGWNPGIGDADCFYATDRAGYLVGKLGGDPIACISVVKYEPAFAFLGFYIVKPELRGQGYGWRIWQDGMARLDGRAVGLDGVIAQQENYQRSGFVLAHRNIRFGGVTACEEPRDARIVPIDPNIVDAVVAYDRPFFPATRDAFIRCWLRPQRREGRALIEDGAIRGYGVIRPCRSGFKIGPLFADSDEGADLLFRALAARAKGAEVFLDCPEPNRGATGLAGRYRLSPVFETARMYRGAAPALPLARIYGITTFELG
ncbi:MAG: GNAT family N-acetyltransferase [Xanthobacteraceae bacterium]|nr:GNAT family N-acetyltransferase [Xanthobacteraceae bacterium]